MLLKLKIDTPKNKYLLIQLTRLAVKVLAALVERFKPP